jgi:glycosyltransferase involved in cell wall biosynthesis
LTRKPHLVVAGPLPPPVHGVTVSTGLVLGNRYLAERFDVTHLDLSDHRTGENIGRFDYENVRVGVMGLLGLARLVHKGRGTLYLPISQNRLGFLRDSLLILFAAMFGWCVAIHLRGSDFPRFQRSVGPGYRRWIALTLRNTDAVGVMSSRLRFVMGPDVPKERVTVVPNGTPEPSAQATPATSSTVLFLSNLRRRKGVEQALRAALTVIERVPEARFVFAGAWESPEYEAAMRALAAPAGDRIEFLSPVHGADKEQLIADSALLLFPPPEPEGHPRVVLEAVAAGLPVVATDRGAIADTVRDGVSGYVLPDPDPSLLARRVEDLLREPERRARMGAEARQHYLAGFTQDVADRTLADWLTAVSARAERQQPHSQAA